MSLNFKAIIFDFDGVLAESVSVKGDAFTALYEAYGPDIQKQVYDHHMSHGGVSRYEKFRHYQKEFVQEPYDEATVQKLAQQFSDLVERKVVESSWVAGAEDFLNNYAQQVPLYVASATPQEELERIVEKRNMTKYFKAVYGSPISKAEHITTVLKANNWAPEQLVMIGDTMSDYKAADQVGTAFVGRLVDPKNPSPFPEGTIALPDLTELAKTLADMA